jgi:hypothetical protein
VSVLNGRKLRGGEGPFPEARWVHTEAGWEWGGFFFFLAFQMIFVGLAYL